MTRELMEKLIDLVYNSRDLTLTEKIELLENMNLFLMYYEENMTALNKIAEKNKNKRR